jgi:hypothetical protein
MLDTFIGNYILNVLNPRWYDISNPDVIREDVEFHEEPVDITNVDLCKKLFENKTIHFISHGAIDSHNVFVVPQNKTIHIPGSIGQLFRFGDIIFLLYQNIKETYDNLKVLTENLNKLEPIIFFESKYLLNDPKFSNPTEEMIRQLKNKAKKRNDLERFVNGVEQVYNIKQEIQKLNTFLTLNDLPPYKPKHFKIIDHLKKDIMSILGTLGKNQNDMLMTRGYMFNYEYINFIQKEVEQFKGFSTFKKNSLCYDIALSTIDKSNPQSIRNKISDIYFTFTVLTKSKTNPNKYKANIYRMDIPHRYNETKQIHQSYEHTSLSSVLGYLKDIQCTLAIYSCKQLPQNTPILWLINGCMDIFKNDIFIGNKNRRRSSFEYFDNFKGKSRGYMDSNSESDQMEEDKLFKDIDHAFARFNIKTFCRAFFRTFKPVVFTENEIETMKRMRLRYATNKDKFFDLDPDEQNEEEELLYDPYDSYKSYNTDAFYPYYIDLMSNHLYLKMFIYFYYELMKFLEKLYVKKSLKSPYINHNSPFDILSYDNTLDVLTFSGFFDEILGPLDSDMGYESQFGYRDREIQEINYREVDYHDFYLQFSILCVCLTLFKSINTKTKKMDPKNIQSILLQEFPPNNENNKVKTIILYLFTECLKS